MISDAMEAASFISGNMVQAVVNPDTGNLRVDIKEEQIQRAGIEAKRPMASVRQKKD